MLFYINIFWEATLDLFQGVFMTPNFSCPVFVLGNKESHSALMFDTLASWPIKWFKYLILLFFVLLKDTVLYLKVL